MRDIVIPYKVNNSGELETSIALIKKNVPHRNIHVIDFDQPIGYSRSHINQILKLKWAIENLDITEDFYLFNDDFFVMKPVEEIPYYHRGLLKDQCASRRTGYYGAALAKTYSYLHDAYLEPISYELHIPMLFNKTKLIELIENIEPLINKGECPLIRSAYGNIYNVGGECIPDVKNIDNFEGQTFLSTTEQSFKRPIGDYIRSMV